MLKVNMIFLYNRTLIFIGTKAIEYLCMFCHLAIDRICAIWQKSSSGPGRLHHIMCFFFIYFTCVIMLISG